jgi:apolipoprotein N-acyltransferase
MIQVADILGVAGITFYIAMVNGLLAELMLEHPRNKEFKVTLVAAVIIAVMFYGERQLDRTEKSMKAGPMIASLQTNEPLTIDGIGFKADDIFEDMIAMSSESLESSPAMIVWPETMVLNTFDSQYLDLRGSAYRGYEFEHIVRIFSMNSGVAMVIGATGGTAEYKPQSNTVALKDRTNAAYVYDSDGRQLERYDKIHLVPFGEFVPFKYSWPWLYNILMKFTPYPEDDFSLLPGKEFTTYNLATPQGNYRYAIIICYEDTVVPLNRKFVVDANGVKRVDWLVNISNDGWFSWRNDEGDVVPTSELFQHAVICSFRAVENRVGIVRSVNTGVSCFIEPTGRIKYGSAAGTLPGKVTERQGVSGWLADNIAVDDRVTFFSRHGQWLDYLAGIFFWPIIILSFQKLPKKEIEAKNVKVR